jgi:prepilin-type N-terminal cleavage/methylation domain-containing protein
VRGRGGFTLVELVLALVLLGIGLLGSAALMIHSQGLMRRAETREWAASIALSMADSLARLGTATEGERLHPRGRVAWAAWSESGVLRIRIEVIPLRGAEEMVFETARRIASEEAAS